MSPEQSAAAAGAAGSDQTETTLTLPPGPHTLQLLLGDYSHVPHNPAVMSKKITITVTK